MREEGNPQARRGTWARGLMEREKEGKPGPMHCCRSGLELGPALARLGLGLAVGPGS